LITGAEESASVSSTRQGAGREPVSLVRPELARRVREAVDTPTPEQPAHVFPVLAPDLTDKPPIETLPAQVVEVSRDYPLSERTGEPKRPITVLIAIVFAWMSVAVTVGAFCWGWWVIANDTSQFHPAARILTWTHPDPVSALAIVMVLVVGLICVLMVAAAGVVAYNAWAGAPWIRIGALVCLGVLLLSVLLNWWFTAAMAPLAIAAGLLWLPVVKRYLTAVALSKEVAVIEIPSTNIVYGRQPLIGGRG
jgi:magnesium-transporting ATPase (P-type)